MVFQSTVPVAIGLAFTDWGLDGVALLAGLLALGGGFVAFWSLLQRGRFSAWAIAAWSSLFTAFAVSVWLA